jgi:hypothetical protein
MKVHCILWKKITFSMLLLLFYLGNKLEIILSASSGVGGEYLPSGGTGCGGWGDSSVDGKSGTNFALLKDKENRKKEKNAFLSF